MDSSTKFKVGDKVERLPQWCGYDSPFRVGDVHTVAEIDDGGASLRFVGPGEIGELPWDANRFRLVSPAPDTEDTVAYVSPPRCACTKRNRGLRFVRDDARSQGAGLVIQDLLARDEKGRETYGSSLSTKSKNDALQFAYEEALDLCMYLRQELARRTLTSSKDESKR